MSFDYDPTTRHLPQTELHDLDEFDAEADRVRHELNWNLAAFVGVFDFEFHWLCLVQLGYAAERFGGAHPWCLPGGAIKTGELPSTGVLRELYEETGLVISRNDLRPAAWLARPYYCPHDRPGQAGELLLLFATFTAPDDPRLRPNPPETINVTFAPFELERFLEIPVSGEGEVPFQPLAGRHWAWWGRVAQMALEDQFRPPTEWTYSTKEDLAEPPWPCMPRLKSIKDKVPAEQSFSTKGTIPTKPLDKN